MSFAFLLLILLICGYIPGSPGQGRGRWLWITIFKPGFPSSCFLRPIAQLHIDRSVVRSANYVQCPHSIFPLFLCTLVVAVFSSRSVHRTCTLIWGPNFLGPLRSRVQDGNKCACMRKLEEQLGEFWDHNAGWTWVMERGRGGRVEVS